jgi:hypothetical protein
MPPPKHKSSDDGNLDIANRSYKRKGDYSQLNKERKKFAEVVEIYSTI